MKSKKEKKIMNEKVVSTSFLTGEGILSSAHASTYSNPSTSSNQDTETAPPIYMDGHDCPYRDNVNTCNIFINPDKKECILCLLSKILKDINTLK